MEFRLFPAERSWIIGFIVFLSVTSSSVHGSTGGQTCSDKYISQRYFERYDSLLDSEFDDFIAKEIAFDLLEEIQDTSFNVPTISKLNRSIIGEGSHRHLHSRITIKMQPQLKSELSSHSCKIIIIERLPSGVFADPFELQHLVHRGVFADAGVFGDTNLELPSFQSNRSLVEIHMSLVPEENDLEINYKVPLHARYQPLGHGFSRVEFGRPILFLCCSIEGKAPNRTCLQMPTNHNHTDHNAHPVVWEIPCGMKEHEEIVSAVTFGSAVLAALVIILASFYHSDSTVSGKLKHS